MLEAFEAYPSLAACFIAHAKLIEGGPYAKAWAQYQTDHNLDNLIRGIAIHYATDPSYAAIIIQLANSPHVTAAIVAARSAV
jgi:flagellum-specific peptidoglycan hydrolase FlgJ